MHAIYRPILDGIAERFVGQGRDVDRVWRVSIEGQRSMLGEDQRLATLAAGRSVRRDDGTGHGPNLAIPVGLQVRDPWVRRREEAVRRLLDAGVLRTEALVEALLHVAPEDYLPREVAGAMLQDAPVLPPEGALPDALALRVLAMGLEALEPEAGSTVADLTARTGYVAAILQRLVGPDGRVVAVAPRGAHGPYPSGVDVRFAPADRVLQVDGRFDRLWIGACLPRFPRWLVDALTDGGRAVTALGPRFRPADLVVLTRREEGMRERRFARARIPVYGGRGGWLSTSPAMPEASARVRVERWPAPALAAHVLAHLDLGADAANLFDPELPARPWVEGLRAAYRSAPGHLLVQVLALRHATVDALIDELRHDPPAALGDPAGRLLCARFADALQAEAPDFLGSFGNADGLPDAVIERLDRLRQELWEPQGRSAPPLLVLDAPALGRSGRATQVGAERRVAVSLREPAEHALCQVLHEEIHPITDPIVLSERKGAGPRSTAVGSEGWSLHAELEAVAVQATEAFLQARSPDLMPAFRRWVERLQPSS